MSAYEDFCGCGDYACGQCFGADKGAEGNAWVDQELVKSYPNIPQAKRARERLAKYMGCPMDTALEALASTFADVQGALRSIESAKMDRDETALSKARADLAKTMHVYNTLLNAADDATRSAHRANMAMAELESHHA